MNKEANKIIQSESQQLDKLRYIVNKAIENENSILDNLLHPPKEMMSPGAKISDKVAQFGGSWSFIISFLIVLVAWIVYNVMVKNAFDPYPFILMNLVLSCVAALQAPIIMMSQNRQEEKDRKRNENDYLVNMKAELEIKALNQKIDLLLEDQIKILCDSQARQIDLLKNIEKHLKNVQPSADEDTTDK